MLAPCSGPHKAQLESRLAQDTRQSCPRLPERVHSSVPIPEPRETEELQSPQN